MKSQPELSVIFGFFSRRIDRDEAAEILISTRRHSPRGVRVRVRPGVYQLGGLYLYTQLA